MTRVSVTIEAQVAHIAMTRADKRNGLDLPMFEALVDAGQRVRHDPSVRAVVLSGEGKSFCAGLDWLAFMQAGAEASEVLLARNDGPANLAQRVAWIWSECEVPVIAAIQGAAYGGGLQIALGADIRLAAADAQFSVMEVQYGLIPDMGASQTLLRVVRSDIAKELTFTGRIVGAEEALSIGLITRIEADPLAAALTLARTIAAKSPHAIRAGKRLLDSARGASVADSFELESTLQRTLLGSPNQLHAVQATLAKETPTFVDPPQLSV